jgi:putative ABC transport system permease protein
MFRKAVRDLTARKMRTALVVLSVAVGVFGVSAVANLASQLGSILDEKYFASNPPDVTLQTSPVPFGIVQQIEGTENVASAEGRLATFGQWTPRATIAPIQVVGVRDFNQDNRIARTTLRRGAFPAQGEALMDDASLRHFDLNVGDTITVTGASGDTQFRISGTGENLNYPSANTTGIATIFLSLPEAGRLAGFENINSIFVLVTDMEQVDATATRLRALVAENDAVVNGLSVRDPSVQPGRQITQTLGSLLGVFAIIALVTSSFMVVNTIATVVAEQQAQIGAMKAVGATTGMVMKVYLSLALLYGIMGTIVGLALGIIGSYLLLNVMGDAIGLTVGGFSIAPQAVIVGIVIGLGIPLLAALLPIWRGSRVSIRDAIMSYGLSANFGRGLLAKLVMSLTFLPQTGALAARNLIRNQMRVFLTIIGLAAAGASILAVFNAQLALSDLVRSAVQTYNADILLQPSEALPSQRVTSVVNNVQGVEFSEGWFSSNVQTERNASGQLSGVPIDTRVYDTTKVVEGRWFQPGDQGVLVISEQLSRAQNLAVGDSVELTIGREVVRWPIVGITRDLVSGESTFYAPIDEVTRVAGVPQGTVQTVMVKLTDSSRANVDDKYDEISQALLAAGISGSGLAVYQFEDQAISSFNILFVLLYTVVVVVAIVGALGLFGTITMNVLERRKEIGVMRSVGATTGNVLAVFLAEGLLLGMVGWVLALILGIAAAYGFGQLITSLLLPLDVTITPLSIVLTLVAVMGVTVLAALLPSLSAARVRIADILRYS